MKRNKVGLIAVLVAFCCTPTLAPRQAWALNGDPATGVEFFKSGYVDSADRVIGFEIHSVVPMLVGELGVLDFSSDGLMHSHEVGIWTTDGALLVSGVVPSGTAAELFDDFRYVDVADTLLPIGSYVIGATWPANGDEFVWFAESAGLPGYDVGAYSQIGSFFTGPAGSARFNNSSIFALPAMKVGDAIPGDDRQLFWGPNFTRVPEPASVALLTIAVVLGASASQVAGDRNVRRIWA